MARKKAASMKPGGSRSARDVRQSTTPRARSRAPSQKDQLKQLRTLVASHRSKDLRASWKLGELAAQVLEQAERCGNAQRTSRKLAEDIGLTRKPVGKQKQTDDSTLRQMIKFAEAAEYRQAQRLRKAGIPWRGIVYWLGLKDTGHRDQLYDEMVSGLANSTDVREYIKKNFEKEARPRFSGDCAEDFRKAQNQADSLASVLDALRRSLDKHEDCGSARQRRQLTKTVENTRKQINATMKKMRERS